MAAMNRFRAATVLGIGESASLVEARRAFLSLSRLVDPDRFADLSEADRSAANAAIAQLNEAIDVFASEIPGDEENPWSAEYSETEHQPRDDETPWSAEELRNVRTSLLEEIAELSMDIPAVEARLADLTSDSGDDPADAGGMTFELRQEMAFVRNYQDMLDQAHRALARIEAKTYGTCESCGNPIGKFRLQAFPRANLCLLCKEAEEGEQERSLT
jgi:RNA polymerase-binding transcription factor DksA